MAQAFFYAITLLNILISLRNDYIINVQVSNAVFQAVSA